MLRASLAMVGLVGIMTLAGSFAPTTIGVASLAQSEGLLRPPHDGSALAKGDRLARAAPEAAPATISTVELVGVTNATIILRDSNGAVLYRSDPQAGVTVYSKNTDLPVITLKEVVQGSVVQHPSPRREGTEMPSPEPKQKRRSPVGCLGDVSPLAKASADRMPSLCLALLGQALS